MVNFGAEGDEYSILPADSDGVGRADSNGTDFCTVIESIGRNKKHWHQTLSFVVRNSTKTGFQVMYGVIGYFTCHMKVGVINVLLLIG